MIPFIVRGGGGVRVAIVDVRGRSVRTLDAGELLAGRHAYRWNGQDDRGTAVAAGMSFARVQAGETVKQTRLLFLR